jgi:TctA family transporter
MTLENITVKSVYKAVRNILINELMLTKESVKTMINERVQAAVDHYVSTTNIDRMVERSLRVAYKDKNLVIGQWPSQGQTVEEFVRKEIQKEYSDQIKQRVKEVLDQIEIKKKDL